MAKGFRAIHESNPFPQNRSNNLFDVKSMIVLCNLSKSALVMIEYLNKEGCVFEDKFFIPISDYLEKVQFKSRKSYYVGIDELIKFDILAKTKDANFFYINPKYFPIYYDRLQSN